MVMEAGGTPIDQNDQRGRHMPRPAWCIILSKHPTSAVRVCPMSLSSLWSTSQDEILKMHLRQIVALAGSGSLGDGNETSVQFRDLLSAVPEQSLVRWARDAVEEGFQESGFALQDLVNEVGRRLGFAVNHGRYRGKRRIGFDGLWTAPSGHCLVVETKTSDTYPIELKKLCAYRDELIDSRGARYNDSSVLIVIGRQESGGLEAQIRWKRLPAVVRFISVASLLSLLLLRSQATDGGTQSLLSRKIFDLLASDEFFTFVDINPAVRLLDVFPRMALPRQPSGGPLSAMPTPLGAQGFGEDAKRAVKEMKDIVDYVTRKGKVKYRLLHCRFHRLGREKFRRRMERLVADDDHPERELKVVERRGLSGRTTRWVMPNE